MQSSAIRALALAVLAAGCASAQAEWTKFATSKSDQDTYYVDSSSIRRQGSRSKVWALTDHRSVQIGRGAKYRSQKAQFQFDCREETVETTMVLYMSGQMGEGKSVHTDTLPMRPVPVPPETAAAALMEVACSASGHSSASASYGGKVAAAVRPNVVFPDADLVEGNPAAEFDVRLAPDGAIVGTPTLAKSSGLPKWDEAALRALQKTEKLPRDIDGTVPPRLEVSLRPKR